QVSIIPQKREACSLGSRPFIYARRLFWLFLKFVPKRGNCEDQRRTFRVALHFLSQTGHMYIHRAGKRAGVVSPDVLKDAVSGERLSGMLNEILQQFKLAS